MFKFDESLKFGKAGEDLFISLNQGKLLRCDGRVHDFVISSGDLKNKTLELKTDYYDMMKTPNFFFERFSKIETQAPGGPWQAASNKTDLFVYFFPKNGQFFVFETAPLVQLLNSITPRLQLVHIPNITWTTGGYKVLRTAVSALVIKQNEL